MAINAYDQPKYAQFNPLSMQEIWAPSQILREQHDKTEEALAAQESTGATMLSTLNPEKDKKAYQEYQAYMNKITQAKDDLATKGYIDSGRRKSLWEAKSIYDKQIMPIQTLLQKREEAASMENKMANSDTSFRFARRAKDISIDEARANPGAFDTVGVSQIGLQKQVSDLAKNVDKYVEQAAPEMKNTIIPFLKQTMVRSGATIDQVIEASKKSLSPEAQKGLIKVLHGMVDSVVQSNGVYEKFSGDQKAIDEIWNNAAQGLSSAFGAKQFGYQDNAYGRSLALAEATTPPPAGGPDFKEEEYYTPEISDKKAYQEIDDLAKLGKRSKAQMTTELDYQAGIDRKPSVSYSVKNKLLDYAKKYGLDDQMPYISKNGNVDTKKWDEWVDKVAAARKEDLRMANKSFIIGDTKNAAVTDLLNKNVLMPGAITGENKKDPDLNKYRGKDGKWTVGEGSVVLMTKDGLKLVLVNPDNPKETETLNVSSKVLANQKLSKDVDSVTALNKSLQSMSPSEFKKQYVSNRKYKDGKLGYVINTPDGDWFIDDQTVNLNGYKALADNLMASYSQRIGWRTRTENVPVQAKPER